MRQLGGRGKNKRRRLGAAAGAVVLCACLTATAGAIRLQAGDIVVIGDGEIIPSTLPKFHNAPVKLRIHGRLTTVSGALPPILHKLRFEFDRHGRLETAGLPVCSYAQLKTTTVPQARKLCPGAIVGTGTGRAIVKFPEQDPIPVSSPLTFFNGPHEDGKWTIFFHAYNTVPVPAAIVFPVTVKKIDKGIYGYEVDAEIPRISGGYGIPKQAEMEVGREWTFKGERLSYLNARCENGRLQARGEFSFKDGTILHGSFLEPCTVRP